MPVLPGKGIVRKREPHSHPFTSEDGSAAWLLRHDSIGPQASAMAEAGRCWWSGQGMKERGVTN